MDISFGYNVGTHLCDFSPALEKLLNCNVGSKCYYIIPQAALNSEIQRSLVYLNLNISCKKKTQFKNRIKRLNIKNFKIPVSIKYSNMKTPEREFKTKTYKHLTERILKHISYFRISEHFLLNKELNSSI